MAFKHASRVYETCSNTPNASTAFNLSGAKTSARTFVAGIGSTNTCIYCAQAVDGSGAREAAWEIGVGTITDATPDTITREEIIESSNSDAAVDFSASTAVEIFTVDPAGMVDAAGGVFNHVSAGIYHAPMNETNLGSAFAGGNRQEYWPLTVTRPMIITDVAADLITAVAGKSCNIGLHASENGLPSALLTTFGSIGTDTVAFKEITGLSYFLAPGNYFLTHHAESASTKWMGSSGSVDRGSWQGFGVNTADADASLGSLLENNSSAFSAGMFAGGSGGGLSRSLSNRPIAFYKFSEV